MNFFRNFPSLTKEPNAKTLSYRLNPEINPRAATSAMIDELIHAGTESGSIVRICLHRDNSSMLHAMLLFLPDGQGYPLHRHSAKTESYQILTGKIKVEITHSDINNIEHFYLSDENPVAYMPPGTWHSLKAVGGYAVFTEVRQGPFTKTDTGETEWLTPEKGEG